MDEDQREERHFLHRTMHTHRMMRMGVRGRKIIFAELFDFVYQRTWIQRSVPEEDRRRFIADLMDKLDDLNALNWFQVAIDDEAYEAEAARRRGPGARPKLPKLTPDEQKYRNETEIRRRQEYEARERKIQEAGIMIPKR